MKRILLIAYSCALFTSTALLLIVLGCERDNRESSVNNSSEIAWSRNEAYMDGESQIPLETNHVIQSRMTELNVTNSNPQASSMQSSSASFEMTYSEFTNMAMFADMPIDTNLYIESMHNRASLRQFPSADSDVRANPYAGSMPPH